MKLLLIYHDNISPAIDGYFVVTTSSVILQLEHFAYAATMCWIFNCIKKVYGLSNRHTNDILR